MTPMATREETSAADARAGGSWREVLGAFLRLGLTSFGGPVAHLGYFREEFVHRRRWLDDKSYADLVALCQFLPGPASSQVGLAVGLLRGGYAGALAAWIGFTLPSAVAMVAFGYGIGALGNAAGSGWLHGLKVAAVAVVAQAELGMARTLAPDRARATLAVAAAIIALGAPSSWGQIGAIVLGGIVGAVLLRGGEEIAPAALPLHVSRVLGALLLAVFFALLIGCRCWPRRFPRRRSRNSTRSIARARWCSAADTSCCRCCRPRSCRRAGSTTTPFSPVTAPHKPCPDRCSPSPPISAR